MTEYVPDMGIVEGLKPLYDAKTAHESFELGLRMLNEADEAEQLKLLQNPAFVRALQGAINGLDESQKSHLETLSDVVKGKNKTVFFEVF